MSTYLIQDSTMAGIANAIRAKTGSSATMTPAQMATEIGSISGGSSITVEPLTVTKNGTTTAPSGTAYSPVTVNVPQPSGTKNITISQNGTTTEDVAQYANAEITVNVPSGTSLPSTVSAIDGGTFTLASDTAGTSHWISHNLGVLPKQIVIWTDDNDLRTSTAAVAQRYLLCSQLTLIDWTTGTTANALFPQHLFRNTNGATSNTGSPIAQAAVGNYIQTTRFNNALGAAYYKAGVEYKWVAYA